MQMSQMHYLPMTPGFFSILVGIFLVVLVLRSVRYAYESLGISSGAAMWLLFFSLVGSIFNIPIADLPPEQMMSDQVDRFLRHALCGAGRQSFAGTVIAVNVGGAVIPTLMSIYLLFKHELWAKGLVATAIVAVVIHWLANPVPGLGIAVPVFVPVLITAIVAVLLSRAGRCAARLYRRRPRHADRRRPDQSRQSGRPRRAGRFDRRRRNL